MNILLLERENMAEENIIKEFRLKIIDGTRNYFTEENDLIWFNEFKV